MISYLVWSHMRIGCVTQPIGFLRYGVWARSWLRVYIDEVFSLRFLRSLVAQAGGFSFKSGLCCVQSSPQTSPQSKRRNRIFSDPQLPLADSSNWGIASRPPRTWFTPRPLRTFWRGSLASCRNLLRFSESAAGQSSRDHPSPDHQCLHFNVPLLTSNADRFTNILLCIGEPTQKGTFWMCNFACAEVIWRLQ